MILLQAQVKLKKVEDVEETKSMVGALEAVAVGGVEEVETEE